MDRLVASNRPVNQLNDNLLLMQMRLHLWNPPYPFELMYMVLWYFTDMNKQINIHIVIHVSVVLETVETFLHDRMNIDVFTLKLNSDLSNCFMCILFLFSGFDIPDYNVS